MKEGSMVQTRSSEAKQEILAQVRAKIKSGLSIKDAIQAVGISNSNYYAWKKAPRAKKPPARKSPKSRPTAIMSFEVPEQKQDQIVVIIGSAAQVKHSLDRLAQIQGRG